MTMQNILRAIPKVDLVLEESLGRPELEGFSRAALLEAVRQTLESLRRQIMAGQLTAPPDMETLLPLIRERAELDAAYSLRPLINATGVALHTNLGRAPLSAKAAAHAASVASSYSTLEYNTEEGARGSRHVHLEKLLTKLTGCEAAMAVNNNAAAVLLVMSALFAGKELIVSRGEMVEIGGAFRIPDVMEAGGARLKAVGTTNKTRLSDYALAIDPEKTGGILKVHTSNFRIIGYTEAADPGELAELAHSRGLPMVYDLGGGALVDLAPIGIHDEPTIQELLKSGVDLVCFSGDKLLGGPQAGILAGRADLVAKMKKHPLARALRVDKMTLAALEATLKLYLDPDEAKRSIPTLAMLFADLGDLEEKARTLGRKILEAAPSLTVEIERTESQTGGGAAPEKPLASWGVSVKSGSISEAVLEERLRRGEPAVIVRTGQDRLLLDVRTVATEDFDAVARALKLASV